MKTRIHLLIISLFALAIICACNKNNDTVSPTQVFTWSIDNGATQSADTITFITLLGYNYIYGIKGTTSVFAATNDIKTGNYSSALATGAAGLRIGSVPYNQTSAVITITSNTNRRLSGSFNGTFVAQGGSTIAVSGTFKDIAY